MLREDAVPSLVWQQPLTQLSLSGLKHIVGSSFEEWHAMLLTFYTERCATSLSS